MVQPSELSGDAGTRSILLIDYFAKVKTDEFSEFHAAVTPWEVNRYLTLV